ncbi:Hsp70 family protein [Crossiella sp. NPDC003009]
MSERQMRPPLRELVRDWLAGGAARRLSRAADRLAAGFPEPPSGGVASDGAVRDYGGALRLALRVDPPRAEEIFRSYDARIPPERYPLTAADESWLTELTTRADRHALTVVFEVATRLRLPELQIRARDRMTVLLATGADADAIVIDFERWRAQGLLEAGTVTRVLGGFVARGSLARDEQLWRLFFEHLPSGLVPDLFEVRCFLGHGAAAVRLAETPAQVRQALDCCLRSTDVDDVAAGLVLARERADERVAALVDRLADLLFDAGRYAEALSAYQEAGQPGKVSRCHEELGEFFEAMATCPADRTERLGTLADRCRTGIHRLIDRQEFTEAARQVQGVIAHLDRASEPAEALTARRADLTDLRATLLGATRRHFGELVRHSTGQQGVYRAWSRFEEAAGEPAQAARRAEDGGEFFRANQLFLQARQFGEAVRVLREDHTPDALAARAEACEAGGDVAGAARLYERIGQRERAVPLFMAAGEFAAAATCLVQWLGGAAAEDARLAECLRRTGDYDELARRCIAAVAARGASSLAAETLRQLTDDGLVPRHRAAEVSGALDSLGARERHQFEERAQAWVGQARADVDTRFSDIWGFDLGTTTCAAAVYDTESRQPVFCPWRGQVHFASTVSLDREGNELVGLSGEETLAPWLVGHIDAAKRRMGRGTVYKVRNRAFRPEEVAARLIRHARGLVETFLAGQVRERVAELARAEIGVVRKEWLSWAEQNHDLRLDRPRVVVTIPAYFANNQKAATRSACRIAGVELVRLIHEPTAACITAARERRLTDAIAVVDLGAGTLDLSLLDVGDSVYDVRDVGGDTQFGGKDLDAAITRALVTRLERQGIAVPARGAVRRRLEIAAESLKVDLSAQEHASYELRGLGDRDVRLELSRAELADILAEPLARLRKVCADFRSSLGTRPKHLVLVGRPMLSPLARETVEDAFGLARTVVSDPRTAVASGAALLGAMRAGSLDDVLLLDVTPLSLGIRIRDEHDRESLSELIPRNTTIPTKRSDVYTTHDDLQTVVRIEIFNGALDQESKIGQFELTGIPPAEKGVPKIDVTFEIDADCVLAVTARDQGTGKSNSIRIADTTLLSPREVADLTRRYEHQRETEQRQRDATDLRDRLRQLVESTMDDDSGAAWQEFRHRQRTHRPAPGAADAETRVLLVEMFNEVNQTELDLDLARRALRESAVASLDYLEEPHNDVDADLAETTRLTDELNARTAGLRELTTKVARWNAVLVRLALDEPDPLQRFRNHYAAGDHRQALAAHPQPPADAGDIRRYAHCLAETGDLDGYRALRHAAGSSPGPVPAALVRIQVAGSPPGAGFLVQDWLVVTSRSWLTDSDTIVVETGDGARATTRVHLPDSPDNDLAVLRLAAPVAVVPLRLGYAKLVRIGDPVWTPDPADTAARVTGLIDQFESVADLQVFRTGVRIPPSGAGGPVLNDLGEVIGVIVSGKTDGARVLSVDALDPLLGDAGFDRHG